MRAKEALDGNEDRETICYAGLVNPAIVIEVNKDVHAVLIYGQMSPRGTEHEAVARERHEKLLASLDLPEDQKLELEALYEDARRFSDDELTELQGRLLDLKRWFTEMLTDRDEVQNYFDDRVHDLQTRMQPILAHAEVLLSDLEAGERRVASETELAERSRQLLSSVKAIRTLVWNLGDFMPSYLFKRHSVLKLVENAITTYKAEAERKCINIYMAIGPIDEIEMSRDHLQQAFDNLVHNAVKYSFRGVSEKRRYIEIWGQFKGTSYEMVFSNYGIGILPSERQKVFAEGYQGTLTRAEYRGGAGKGLTIAKQIIEAHGGAIEIDSRNQGGEAYRTTVMVRLPALQPRS